jgi:hypothetical protein
MRAELGDDFMPVLCPEVAILVPVVSKLTMSMTGMPNCTGSIVEDLRLP